MNKASDRPKFLLRATAGLLIGAGLAYLDGYAFGGETSPIVVIACLLAAIACVAAAWGSDAWVTALLAWIMVPSVHVLKHARGVPDTIHPNTYMSIGYLVALTLAVAFVGGAVGLLVRKFGRGSS